MFNKILHGSAVEMLKRYDNKCIDLTVTSPPYDDIRYYSDGFIAAFDKTVEDFTATEAHTAEQLYKRALSKFKKQKIEDKLKANNGYSFA